MRAYRGSSGRALGSQCRNLAPGFVRVGLIEKKITVILTRYESLCMNGRGRIFSEVICPELLLNLCVCGGGGGEKICTFLF